MNPDESIDHLKAFRIFLPDLDKKSDELLKGKSKLVHYTSSEKALLILQTQEVWMRNARIINDFSEMNHGIHCICKSIRDAGLKTGLPAFMESLEEVSWNEFTKRFDGWTPHFENDSYIFSVSEHPPEEDIYGRLSMWRAYGGNSPVALVLNKEVFCHDSDVLHAYAFPVEYNDPNHVSKQLEELVKRMKKEQVFLMSLGPVDVQKYLFMALQAAVYSTKHPGFREEKEWRIVYNPKYEPSDLIKPKQVSVGEIAQTVQTIALKNYTSHGLPGMTLPELLDKVIIGPSDNSRVIGNAIKEQLTLLGIEDAESRISYADIPLC